MNNIGELSEKEIHHTIKMMISNGNTEIQEIKVGRYIADIKVDNNIKEIQTSNFKNLVTKLNYYLSEGYNVEVTYPLINKSQIHYISRETQQEEYAGKKYIYKTKYDALRELYWLKQFIGIDIFSIRIMLLEIKDYRYSDNKQKIKKIPADIVEEIVLHNVEDFRQFIPHTLKKQFSAKDFKRETKTRSKYYHQYLRLLEYFDVISNIGKNGNAIIWQLNYM